MLMASAPRIMMLDPAKMSSFAEGLRPAISPKTSAPHARPQS